MARDGRALDGSEFMVGLEAQVDLTGNKLKFEKDRIESWKDVFTGAYFQIIVSEESHSKIDRMHEKGQDTKVKDWIVNHMKPRPKHTLPREKEGEAFQMDFELFAKIL